MRKLKGSRTIKVSEVRSSDQNLTILRSACSMSGEQISKLRLPFSDSTYTIRLLSRPRSSLSSLESLDRTSENLRLRLRDLECDLEYLLEEFDRLRGSTSRGTLMQTYSVTMFSTTEISLETSRSSSSGSAVSKDPKLDPLLLAKTVRCRTRWLSFSPGSSGLFSLVG